MQGIGCFDGYFTDWVVENNVVITDHWHGISLYGMRGGRVVNNTVIDVNTTSPGPPWIMVTAHKDGNPGESEPAVRVALVLTSLVLAAPVLLHRWAPVADLADHEMVLAGLTAYGDPTRFPSAVYRLQLGAANQLVFALGALLALVFGADLGTRVLVAAILAAFPWAVAHAARTAGRSRFVAIALAPLALGAPFRWGLLAFLLGVTLTLFVLRPLEALARAPGPRRAATVSAWLTVASLAHGSAVVLCGLVLVPWFLRRWREARAMAWAAAAFVGPVVIVILQAIMFDRAASPEFRALANVEHPRIGRLVTLPDNLLGPFAGWTAALLCVLVIAALTLFARRAPRGANVRGQLAVAALLLAQYFIWPYGHHGAGLLYLRFLLPGAVLLGLAVAPAPHRPSRGTLALLAAVPVAVTLALLPLYGTCQAVYASLDRLVPRVAPGSAIAAIDFRATSREASTIIARPAAHIVAQRGGRTWGFPDVPQYPLRVRQEVGWFRSGIRLHNPENLIPEVDLARYRYLLVTLREEAMVPLLTHSLGECARLVEYAEPFALYESRCLRAALTTPEEPLPARYPKTLGWRLRHP